MFGRSKYCPVARFVHYKFTIFETVYKVVLEEHQKYKGKPITHYLKIDMRQVPHALYFAGYAFEKTLLNELFGTSSQRGKTVKELRDATTHGISEAAVAEIIVRKDELFGYMDEFLTGIRSFESNME